MQPGPIAIGWLLSAALLIAEHVALWGQPWRLQEPWNYLVGVLTLGVGWIAWGLSARGAITPIDAVANIGLVSSAGTVIMLAYYVRGRLHQHRASAQRAGEIVGAARSLTQELIDSGGSHAARQPDVHDPGRRN